VKTFRESSPVTLQEPVTLAFCVIFHHKHRGKGTLSKVKEEENISLGKSI